MSNQLDIIKQAMYSTKISRMLAQENIGVVFSDSASTASFSPEARTLTFPYNTSFMDQDIHELFMMHEVSHALHLPHNSIDIVHDSKIDLGMFNIIIDIRDERLIKKKYPGAIKSFIVGYEKLMEQGFFGKREAINLRCFADRLNVYAKLGIKSGHFVRMSPEEMEFYNRCMLIETFEEAMEMAKELQNMPEHRAPLDTILEFLSDDILALEDEVNDEGDPLTDRERQERIDQMVAELQQERVQDLFDENFKQTVMSNVHVVNYESARRSAVRITDPNKYVSYVKKTFSNAGFNQTDELNSETLNVSDIRETRKSIQQSVDSMVRIFEAKKAAERYKNAKVSDTGLIDINKVHRYQFDDKIFRKSVKVPNSKNHGFYILVDMSGSMSSILSDVIEQVLVITEFLRRIQVPYKVVGFGACVDNSITGDSRYAEEEEKIAPSIIRSYYKEYLFEILNSEQTTLEHNTALTGLTRRAGYSLGGTPTGHAMLYAEIDANEFFNRTGVSKKNLIVMTDGEPTDLVTSSYGVRGKTLLFADSKTKKVIVTKGNADYASINAIGKIFEYRYDIKMTTICIAKALSDHVTSAFVSNSVSESNKTDWRVRGFTKIVDPFTKNDVFFAKPFNVDTDVSDFSIEDKKTSTQIARSLIKNMKSVKKSRSFLNSLAETLS